MNNKRWILLENTYIFMSEDGKLNRCKKCGSINEYGKMSVDSLTQCSCTHFLEDWKIPAAFYMIGFLERYKKLKWWQFKRKEQRNVVQFLYDEFKKSLN